MTTWADLFDRAASLGVDADAIRETLDRQRTDDEFGSGTDSEEGTDG